MERSDLELPAEFGKRGGMEREEGVNGKESCKRRVIIRRISMI